jgi:hypothetical protein
MANVDKYVVECFQDWDQNLSEANDQSSVDMDGPF